MKIVDEITEIPKGRFKSPGRTIIFPSTVLFVTRTCYTFFDLVISLDGRGLFWPIYDREPGVNPFDGEPNFFRHFCYRGLVVNFLRPEEPGEPSVEVVQAYEHWDDDFVEFFDPIDWWFVPSVDAMIELFSLISSSDNPETSPPPETGDVKVSLYLEMHREFYWNNPINPDPPPSRLRGVPRRIQVGDETSSLPVVLKFCVGETTDE